MVKRKLNVRALLLTLNVLVLLIIACFYSFRMVKYYLKENGNKDGGESSLLVDNIIKKQSYVDLTKGLIYDEENESYRYIGNVSDNYLKYSGSLYRIIEVDSEYNIKAVLDKSITHIYSGLNNGFNDSYINNWLNENDLDNSGIFEHNLYKTELLFNTTICEDVIDDITNITCEDENKDNKFGILSLYDYAKSGGKSGFLNNGEEFYLSTLDSNNNYYYITKDGEVSISKSFSDVYGLRSVITISGDVNLISGNGSIESPYVIEEHDINTVKDLYVGNYITINNNKYIVNDISSDNVKISLYDSIKDENNNIVSMIFSNDSSVYGNEKNSVYNYLNNEYYNSLGIDDLIVKDNYYIGKLSLDNLDYRSIFDNKVSANIGMLTLGDTYIQDIKNVFTLYRGIEDNKIINVINNDGKFYGDFVTSRYGVRPAFYIKGDIKINGGLGSFDKPYEIGVNDGKEGQE